MQKAFINSLPKSGTNLLAKCLLLFGYSENGHLSAGTVLDKRLRSLYKRWFWRTKSSGYVLGVNSPIEVRRAPVDAVLRRTRRNQFVTGHVGYRADLLDAIIAQGFVPIQVIRDPRAVLASFVPYVLGDSAHFLNPVFSAMLEEERYRAMLDGVEWGSSVQRPLKACCRALDPWLQNENVYVVRFEDIVGGRGGGSDSRQQEVLGEIADRLGIENVNLDHVSQELFGPGRHTFRKGRVDTWKDEIPEELIVRLNTELGDVLRDWGYEE